VADHMVLVGNAVAAMQRRGGRGRTTDRENQVRNRLAGGEGFEPSVPRKMGYRFETAFVASVTVPIAEKGLTSSRPGAEGLNPHSLSRCPHESHSV
jgi:hypothetical protein